jgi:nicotinate-nucleotide adenylyltransferase
MAETAREQFLLEKIILIPTYSAPHKIAELADFEHRMTMVELAIADNPHLVASNLEQVRGGISYAALTLKELQKKSPQTSWYWIVGLDTFQSLPRWHRSTELATECIWLVAPRDTKQMQQRCQQVVDVMANRSAQIQWHRLKMPQMGISSSLIRHGCKQGHSLRYLLPDPVRYYIIQHQLYQN